MYAADQQDTTCGYTVGRRNILDGRRCLWPSSPSQTLVSSWSRLNSTRSLRTVCIEQFTQL